MDVDYGATHMGLHINFYYGGGIFDAMSTIGTRIKTQRRTLGLTQGELAESVGLDQSIISDIERGAGFSAQTLMDLSGSLHLTPEFIMNGASVENFGEVELCSLYRAMEPEKKESLVIVARSFANKGKTKKSSSGNRQVA